MSQGLYLMNRLVAGSSREICCSWTLCEANGLDPIRQVLPEPGEQGLAGSGDNSLWVCISLEYSGTLKKVCGTDAANLA